MFIGIVSHDLRSPLATIGLMAGLLLRQGRLDKADQETVSRIVNSCERMNRMITQLLDFTRVRLGGGFPFDGGLEIYATFAGASSGNSGAPLTWSSKAI